MKALDLGDRLVDPSKSTTFLHYLAQATWRVKQRELSKEKIKISLRRLKKLSTKELHAHIEEVEDHIEDALSQAQHIKKRQHEEEHEHKTIHQQLERLHKKIDSYLDAHHDHTQRLKQLEKSVHTQLGTKHDHIEDFKEDLKKLKALYEKAKKSKKYNTQELLTFAKRIAELKDAVEELK